MSEREPHPTLRQAPEAFNGRLLAAIIIATIVMTVVGVVVARFLLREDRAALGDVVRTPGYPVSERVGDIEQLPIGDSTNHATRARASRDSLQRYGWADKSRGLAQIPIERAMRWLVDDAERGALRSPDPATTPAADRPPETR